MIINLKASTASFVSDLSRVKNLSFSTAQEIGRSFQVIGIAAVGIAGTFAAMAARSLETTIQMAANMQHAAEKAGTTVEAFSGLAFAAKQVNIDQEALGLGLARLAKNALLASEGSKVQAQSFKALHVSVVDAHGALRPMQDLILDVAAAFSKAESSTAKTAIAMTTFGKAGYNMIPFLNLGPEGIKAFIKQAEDLGLILDSKTTTAAVRLEQEMKLLEGRFTAIKISMLRDVIPVLEVMAERLTQVSKAAANAGPPKPGFWSEATKASIIFFDAMWVSTKQLYNDLDGIAGIAKAIFTLDWGSIGKINDEQAEKRQKLIDDFEKLRYELNEAQHLPTFGSGLELPKNIDPKSQVGAYLTSLSGRQIKQLVADADELGQKYTTLAAARAALHAGTMKTPDVGGETTVSLAEKVKKLTEELKSQIAVFGLGHDAAQIYKLGLEGATKATLAELNALESKLQTLRAATAITAELARLTISLGKESKLANAIGDVVANTLLATSAAEAEVTIEELLNKIGKDRGTVTEAQKTSIRELITLTTAYKAAAADNKSVQDFIAKIAEETVQVRALGQAWGISSEAVQRAQEAAKVAPFEKQARDLAEVIAKLKEVGAAGDVGVHLKASMAELTVKVKATGAPPEVVSEILAPFQRALDEVAKGGDALAPLEHAFDELQKKIAAARDAIHGLSLEQTRTWSAETLANLQFEIGQLENYRAAVLGGVSAVREYNVEKERAVIQKDKPLATPEEINAIIAARRTISDLTAMNAAAEKVASSQSYLATMDEIHALELLRDKELQRGADVSAIDQTIALERIKYAEEYQQAIFEAQNAELLGAARIYDMQRRLIEQWDAAAMKVGTFGEQMRAVLNQVILEGENMGAKIATSIGHAVNGISGELAHMVVTGKSNFRQLFQSLEEEILRATFQKAIGQLTQKIFGKPQAGGPLQSQADPGMSGERARGPFATPPFLPTQGVGGFKGAVAGILGIKAVGMKAEGTRANPYYVVITNSAAGSIPGAPTPPSGGGFLGSLLPGFFGGSVLPGTKADGSKGNPFYTIQAGGPGAAASGGIEGMIGSGLSGLFGIGIPGEKPDGSKGKPFYTKSADPNASMMGAAGGGESGGGMGIMGSIFGLIGMFAEGGRPEPHAPVVVGEKGPEIFKPDTAGTIIPNRELPDLAARAPAMKITLPEMKPFSPPEIGGLAWRSLYDGGSNLFDHLGAGAEKLNQRIAQFAKMEPPAARPGPIALPEIPEPAHNPGPMLDALIRSVRELREVSGIPKFAEGGRPDVGEISIVGERGPEAFVPDAPGTVVPSDALAAAVAGSASKKGNTINMGGVHFHGVRDFDSFRRSSAQVATHFQNQLAIAHQRNS